jgi:lipoprotein signal peptidase
LQATRGTALNGSGTAGDPDHGAAGSPGPAPRPRRVRLLLIIAAGVFVADLISKTIVVATLSDRAPVRLLGGLLTLRELRNSGAAFSIGTSVTVVFTLIALGVIVAILRTARRLRSVPWAVTLGLLLGGAAGNLGDRLFRSPGFLRGHVVDWIELPHWPVFNVADSCIVCGGVLAVLLAARGISLEGRRPARPDRAGVAVETGEQGHDHGHGTAPGIGETPPGPRTAALDATTPGPDRPAAPRTSRDGSP